MTYTLRYERRVFKDLDRIPGKNLIRLDKAILGLTLQPFPVGVKALVGAKGLYRLRQGDYRMIYTVDHQAKVISLLGIRHRKDAYR